MGLFQLLINRENAVNYYKELRLLMLVNC